MSGPDPRIIFVGKLVSPNESFAFQRSNEDPADTNQDCRHISVRVIMLVCFRWILGARGPIWQPGVSGAAS
jgi:hypothetical protein